MSKYPLTMFLLTAIVLTALYVRRLAISGKPLLAASSLPRIEGPRPAAEYTIPLPPLFPGGPARRGTVRPGSGVPELPPSGGVVSPWGR